MGDPRDMIRTHQATVYNICFQVLRSAHDAEDATQETLLEISRGAATVREPRAFKRWICRVALHTALDHLKRRKRRAHHEEKKAAMKSPAADPARDAVHEALAQLEDDDRCLLVEKYFERSTLEEIGAREGVTAAAVGKRVDRAKENLKRRLIQTGFASVALSVDSLLEASPAVPPVPPLVHPVATGVAAGAPAFLITVLVVAASAAGTAAWVLRPGRTESTDSRFPVPAAHKNSSVSALAHGASDGTRSPSAGELSSRLLRYRSWYDQVNPPAAQATFSLAGAEGPEPAALRAEIAGLREMILQDPAAFLAWIALPENLRGLNELLAALAFPESPPDAPLCFTDDGSIRFEDFPPALMRGLLSMIHTAPDELKEVLLGFAGCLKEPPESWRSACVNLVAAGPDLAYLPALRVLLNSGGPSLEETRLILATLEVSRDQARTTNVVAHLSPLDHSYLKVTLLNALESGKIPDSQGQASICFLEYWLQPDKRPDDALEDRAVELFARALRDDRPDIYRVIVHSLSLAPHRAEKIVLLAYSQTTKPGIHHAIQELLGPLRAGGRSPKELKELWSAAWRGKHIPAGGVAEQR